MAERDYKLTDKKTVVGTGMVSQFRKGEDYVVSAFLAEKLVKAGKVTFKKGAGATE
jgi:hypothetical protein